MHHIPAPGGKHPVLKEGMICYMVKLYVKVQDVDGHLRWHVKAARDLTQGNMNSKSLLHRNASAASAEALFALRFHEL